MDVVTQLESARMANGAGLSRAQADILAWLLGTGDKYSGRLMVPTNYQSAAFVPGPANPNNVNHTNALTQGAAAWVQNLGNLQYDPRLPVFSQYYNNVTPYDPLQSETNQGRWYLDFNRSGMFEYTDRVKSGDPHWIGMLEYPDALHGPNNRGVARYTYLVVPAS